MRIFCRLLGGHYWSEWAELLIAGWTMNGDPMTRYCRVCTAFDYNRDGLILTQIAWHGE